ncbi:hypothetical protein [Haloterrigena salifodinae]|nr:hypothetical protein [Haloterrigena salifodinae]
MTHHSDQQQHDRTGEQYGQLPEARGPGTRTGTGMDTQPQFGGSSEQSETGDQETSVTRDWGLSTSRSTTGQQGTSRQQAGRPIADRGSEPMRGRQRGGQQMSGHRDGQRTDSHQMGMQHQQGGGQPAQAPFFEDHMTDELWIALEDFSELAHVAAWCATRCASGGPELGRCTRICQDLAEIAALNELLIARDSMFGPELATAFLRVADEGLPTLRQFQQRHPHVLETVATIERTMNSCESLLRRVGGSQGRQGSGTGAGSTGSRGMQGMAEQGRYGQGMSGQPRGGSEVTGQRY